MEGAAAGVPAVVRVVEEIKNAVGTCGFSSPPEVDLRLGITADGRYVFVIREAVQCALLNLKAQDNKALEGKASQDLAQKLGIGSLATDRWPGATHAQATCEVRHIGQVLTWALSRHGGTRWLPINDACGTGDDCAKDCVRFGAQRAHALNWLHWR